LALAFHWEKKWALLDHVTFPCGFSEAPYTRPSSSLSPGLRPQEKTQWLTPSPGKRNSMLFTLETRQYGYTCGMPYWSMTCQMYQSSFLDVFLNRKVVTKAYSSGRPWGNTSLRKSENKQHQT
jgi:hypothetical protein